MASIFMRFPEGRTKALTLSYDDGVEQDIRLIEIMNTNRLKGTFNINSGLFAKEGTIYPADQISRRMTKKQVMDTYLNSGHEVAVHSLTHPFLEQLPVGMVASEIIKDRENLESEFGTIIRGMAYPFGTFSDSVVEAIHHCGIVYARTVMTTNDFRIPKDWMRLAATCNHISPELMSLAKRFVEEKASRAPYLFYLWGHSYEFDRDNNWNVIEEFAAYTGGREEIWYATNIQIYDYIDAYNRLIFSIDGKRVKNPSCTKIWFDYSGKIFEIQAGELALL